MKKENLFHVISCAIIIVVAIFIFLNIIDGSDTAFEAQLNETLVIIASSAGLIYLSRFITFAIKEKKIAKRKIIFKDKRQRLRKNRIE